MAARTLRRRLHRKDEHEDAAGLYDLNEPLLGNSDTEESYSQKYGYGNRKDGWDNNQEELHWSHLFSNLVSQWAQWFAIIIFESGSVLTRLLTQNGIEQGRVSVCLSPLQEERLRYLKKRLEIPFDGSCDEHRDALKKLWRLAYPNRPIPPLKSELWKEMGWQGTDPATDFRGGGFVSLENLIFFAENYPEAFQRLLHKQEGRRAEWEYPFAVAGINVSFLLIQMLGLQSGLPASGAGVCFLELLGADEAAFDELYCVAFRMLDAQWLAKRASYMEFNEVLKATKAQLEREMALEDVSTVKDLPAYNMLCR